MASSGGRYPVRRRPDVSGTGQIAGKIRLRLWNKVKGLGIALKEEALTRVTAMQNLTPQKWFMVIALMCPLAAYAQSGGGSSGGGTGGSAGGASAGGAASGPVGWNGQRGRFAQCRLCGRGHRGCQWRTERSCQRRRPEQFGERSERCGQCRKDTDGAGHQCGGNGELIRRASSGSAGTSTTTGSAGNAGPVAVSMV